MGRKPLLRRGRAAAIALTLLLAACGTGATTGETPLGSTAPTTGPDSESSDVTDPGDTPETSAAPDRSTTTNTSQSTAPTNEQDPEGEESQTQVIVDLAVDWRPEAELGSEDEVAQQRDAIRAAQDAIVGMLADTEFDVVALYEATPQMALRVDAAALDLLRSSDLVSQVTEDVPAAPTG